MCLWIASCWHQNSSSHFVVVLNPHKMRFSHQFSRASAAVAGLVSLVNADSSTYYFKHFNTSGTISPWYSNDNSWGVNADGSGFVVMVTGEDWGTWSPVHTLPKQLKDVNPSHSTWFSQNANPASGHGFDAW